MAPVTPNASNILSENQGSKVALSTWINDLFGRIVFPTILGFFMIGKKKASILRFCKSFSFSLFQDILALPSTSTIMTQEMNYDLTHVDILVLLISNKATYSENVKILFYLTDCPSVRLF